MIDIKKSEFKSFIDYKKRCFPNLYKKEQEDKKFTRESWGRDLWNLFKQGFENLN